MIEFHPSIETPSEDRPLWRYLDIGHYLSMLSTSKLHFTRSDSFEDPWEGAVPISFFQPFAEESKPGVVHLMKGFSKVSFINCWHMSEFESQAMWRLYGNQGSNIAIFTHMRELRDSLSRNPEPKIFCGVVKYIDYQKDSIPPTNVLNPWFHKRLGFEFEREVRLMFSLLFDRSVTEIPSHVDEYKDGFDVDVDLRKLIKKVYVSPKSKKWFLDAVKCVTEKFGLDPRLVEQSSVDDPPNYNTQKNTPLPDPSSPTRGNAGE